MWLKKNTLTAEHRIRRVDLVERKASVPRDAMPFAVPDRTRSSRGLSCRNAIPEFPIAVGRFAKGIEADGAAVPETKGHGKVDLVERKACVPLKAEPAPFRAPRS